MPDNQPFPNKYHKSQSQKLEKEKYLLHFKTAINLKQGYEKIIKVVTTLKSKQEKPKEDKEYVDTLSCTGNVLFLCPYIITSCTLNYTISPKEPGK